MSTVRSAADRYLWFRKNSAYIWFSMPVPKEHRVKAGRKLIQLSLGTSDKREARLKAGELRAQLHQEWTCNAQAKSDQAVPRVSELALGIHEKMLAVLDSHRRELPDDDAVQDAHLERREADLRRLTRRVADGDLTQWVAMADRMIAEQGLAISPGTVAHRQLVHALIDACIEALSVFTRKYSGDLDAQPRSELLCGERKRQREAAPSGERILNLFDRYGAQRLAARKKRPDSIKQDRIVVASFAEFIGVDRRLASVSRAEVREWRDLMAALPIAFRNSNAYRGLDMRAAAAKAREANAPTLSVTTVNKNLSAVSSFYRWAVSDGLVDVNPCDDLALPIAKGANERDPFSADQLNRILQSPLFTGFEKDGAEHKIGKVHANDWRRWIPLCAMFTGARIGEIAQLTVDDIEEIHGRSFIHIRHNVKTGQRTKSGKSRLVPIHRRLEQMGFLRFHVDQRSRAGGGEERQLFPDLQANARDHIGAVPSKWWRRYLEKIGVKSGGDGLGAHSFRHTLADELRAAGFADSQFGPMILGHDKGGVTSKYGRTAQGTAEMLCAMIDGVSFKGVRMSHLIKA